MAFGMVPAKKSPMVEMQQRKPPPKSGDDFDEKTLTPNRTSPSLPSRDGPAQDMRKENPQKPKTHAKAKNFKIGKSTKPPAKAPGQSSMPQKTIDAMRDSLSKMGSFHR